MSDIRNDGPLDPTRAQQLADDARLQGSTNAQKQQAARVASSYGGVVFAYAEQLIAPTGGRAHHFGSALQRRWRQVRKGSTNPFGDGEADAEGADDPGEDVEPTAHEHRDAGYMGPAQPNPARARPRARRRQGKDGQDGSDAIDGGGGEGEQDDDPGEYPEKGRRDGAGHRGAEGVHEAPRALGERPGSDGRSDADQGGGGQGGRQRGDERRSAAAERKRSTDGQLLPAGSRTVSPRRLKAFAVAPGLDIGPGNIAAGPLEKLAATLPADTLRDDRLHQAHFDMHWRLCGEALGNRRAPFDERFHAIEHDWLLAQHRHGAVRPEPHGRLRDRLIEAGRQRPLPAPDASDRGRATRLMLIMVLALHNGQKPSPGASRKVAIDTRRVQKNASRLSHQRRQAG